MSEHDHLLGLLFLVAVTVLGPMVALRVRLPTAVVLILAGMAMGPAGIGLVREAPTLAFVSEFGFLVLMFLAGMELDFEAIRHAGLRALLVPSLAVAAIFILAVVSGVVFALPPISVLVISAMSVGMPLAMLQESAQTKTPFGRYVLLTASIGEFVCILGITGFEMMSGHDRGLMLAIRIVKVVLLFGFAAFLIRWARALVWWYPESFRRLVEHHDVAELGVRVGLLVMLGFVAMMTLFGVEAILGAFLAGALVGFVLREKNALESKLAALGHGLFIPIFFVMVGVRFDPSQLDLAGIRGALGLVGLVGFVKLLPPLVFADRDMRLGARLAAGALLAAPLTLVVAIGAIGQKLGVITSSEGSSIVLVAMILSVVFPVLFKNLASMLNSDRETPASAATLSNPRRA